MGLAGAGEWEEVCRPCRCVCNWPAVARAPFHHISLTRTLALPPLPAGRLKEGLILANALQSQKPVQIWQPYALTCGYSHHHSVLFLPRTYHKLCLSYLCPSWLMCCLPCSLPSSPPPSPTGASVLLTTKLKQHLAYGRHLRTTVPEPNYCPS